MPQGGCCRCSERLGLHPDNIGSDAREWCCDTSAILAAGADVTLREDMLDMSPLEWAAGMGNADVMKLIIEHVVDVNTAGAAGRAALHLAASNSKAEMVDKLVQAGADIDAADAGEGSTPLHIAAASCRSPPFVIALMHHGASVSKKDARGKSPLHAAAEAVNAGKPCTAEVVDLFLRYGADEKAIDDEGQTAADVVETSVEGQNRRVEDVERVLALLANAPADRAWRRRCFLVLCRARYPRGRVLLRQVGYHMIAKRTRSRSEASRAEVEWAGVASMLMGAGTDVISLMGDEADVIFEVIVTFL